jgi:peptide/nickel transport system permease protein
MGRFAAGVFFAFIDLVRALPSTLMALLVIVGLGSGQWQLMAATGIAFSPLVAYVARSVYQREASREYVLAARSFGGSRMHILKLHLLPNIMGALITQLGIVLPRCIVTESVLSFLGLGSSPDEPTWGRMIADAAPMMERAPHEVIVPLCALVLLTFSLSLLANEWRERLDPIRRLERC